MTTFIGGVAQRELSADKVSQAVDELVAYLAKAPISTNVNPEWERFKLWETAHLRLLSVVGETLVKFPYGLQWFAATDDVVKLYQTAKDWQSNDQSTD